MKNKYVSYALFTSFLAVALFTVMIACTNNSAKAKPNFVYKESGKPGVVAKIGGEEITEDQLMSEDKVSFFDLKKKEYELKMQQLNNLLVKNLVGGEAKKANMSTEEYIEQKVVKGNLKISTKEYNDFLKEKKIPEAQVNAQLKERIESFLKAQKREEVVQAYIAKLTKSTPVEVYFKKPRMDLKVDVGSAPTLGNKDAPVTIVAFSDFQCPFCTRGADVMHEIKKKYGKKVNIAFKHFPLPMHREARPASEASMCVNEQSTDKFWKFHDTVFKNQNALDNASLEKYAKDSGANVDQFKACMESKKFASAVQSDMDYGDKLGVRSTPTFFVNGQLVSGALPIDSFSEIIDDELNTAKN